MEYLLNEAKELYNKNEFADSLKLVSETIIDGKGDVEAFLLRAKISYKMQRWGDAINDFYTVLDLDPTNKEAKVGLQMAKNILGYFTPDMFNP